MCPKYLFYLSSVIQYCFQNQLGNTFLFHVFCFSFSLLLLTTSILKSASYFTLSDLTGKYGCCSEVFAFYQPDGDDFSSNFTFKQVTSHEAPGSSSLNHLSNTSEQETWFGSSCPAVETLEIHVVKEMTGKGSTLECHQQSHPNKSEMLK